MLSLERGLNGVQPAPLERYEHRCRFGIRLDAEKNGPRSGSPALRQPALRQMDALHF